MLPPSPHPRPTAADDAGEPRPEAGLPSPTHRKAVELADRITEIVRTLETLDLTGVPPAPVFVITGHGATSAGRPL